MQLWLHPDAAAVTQLQVFPKHKTMTLVGVAGDGMDDWLDELMETLEAFARDNGCKYMEEWGRKGWIRIGKRYDAEVAYYVMRKAL